MFEKGQGLEPNFIYASATQVGFSHPSMLENLKNASARLACKCFCKSTPSISEHQLCWLVLVAM